MIQFQFQLHLGERTVRLLAKRLPADPTFADVRDALAAEEQISVQSAESLRTAIRKVILEIRAGKTTPNSVMAMLDKVLNDHPA